VEIGSAATAFLCGYLILKLKEGVNCDICLSTLCDASPNKKSPSLELIYNQDRGNLNYPNERFIQLVEFLVPIIHEILPYLPHKKVDYILNKILISYLYTIFPCKIHNYTVCSIIIGKLVSPVLSNYCNSKTQFFKKINIFFFFLKEKSSHQLLWPLVMYKICITFIIFCSDNLFPSGSF
jgi:hypothetical protein